MNKHLTAALLAMPLVLPIAAAHANDRDDMKEGHKEMCSDRYAHAFGKLAFLQAKLGITDKQQDAWSKWQQVELDGAAKERDACLNEKLPDDKAPTVVEQEDHLEKMLSAKLDQLQAARQPLADLYKVLSSDQKQEFDEFGEEMHHRWHHGPEGGPEHGPKGPKGPPHGGPEDKPE